MVAALWDVPTLSVLAGHHVVGSDAVQGDPVGRQADR